LSLGSMFFPKKMKELYDSTEAQNEIDFCHGILYQFTPSKINILLNGKGALKFLLK
jgi:hypothetical protein